MCYEEGKVRMVKTKITAHPLINNKKGGQEPKDKESEKFNTDHNTRPRGHYNNDFTATTEFQSNKIATNYLTVAYNHRDNKERFAGNPNHPNYYVNTNKTLTFANVKGNGAKQKENSLLQPEQPSYIGVGQEYKKTGHAPKNNVLMDKNKYSNMTERVQKPLIDKTMEKKQVGGGKVTFAAKPSILSNHVSQIDDLACTEQLDFKPVEKKSLVPEKKYTADKTTSKFDFAKPKKAEKRNEMRNEMKELKDFEAMEKLTNMNNEGEALNLLCLKQEQYAVDPGYIDKNHKTLIWWSRAILVDWMRHICYQFGIQRDTYHIAVVLLDNYLARTVNVPKSILQAIGATTLFIASKLQELQCRESREFAKSTNNSCSVQDIHQLQLKITLRYKLNPPTLYSLANMMMSQWDIFISSNDYGKSHPLFVGHERVTFKQLDENSYKMFREMMQLIDCSVIDIQTAQYKPKMLVCSFMYLLLGRELGIFDAKQIVTEFPGSSLYLIDESSEFNDLFRSFVGHVFGFSLCDILPTVQYCATYFDLVFSYQKPMIREQSDLQSMSLQEYCSYQTYNSGMIKTVKNRYRGIY